MSARGDLRIEIVKRTDGGSVLRCTRADGSVTWQRLAGAQAGFFPMHDLTHYAVESVLGTTHSFFGLVAQGWDIEDTTGMGKRGPLGPEAFLVERLVGLMDIERATGSIWDAQTFASQIEMASPDLAPLARRLTDAQLAAIKALRAELFMRWTGIPAGDALSLRFPADLRAAGANGPDLPSIIDEERDERPGDPAR